MKGFIALSLSLLLVFSVVGCASTGEAGTEAAPAAFVMPAGEVELLDGFEDGNYWAAVGDSWDQWGSHNLSLMAELSDQGVTEGSTSEEWMFDTLDTATPQATFYTDQPPFTEWADVKYIVLDVYNPLSVPVSIVFSCQTTDSWAWTQTPAVLAQPGKSTIGFNLQPGAELLTGDSQPLAAIPGADEMKRVMFNIVGAEGQSGSIFVDNIRVIR